MKKILYAGVLIISLCMFTGCGSKVLECNKDNSYNDEMKMMQHVKVTFKNDVVTKISMDMDVELGETYLEYKDALIESVESEFVALQGAEGLEYSTSKNNNGFNFKLRANIGKMDDSTIEELDIVNTKQSYEATKDEFENDGYTCK